MSTLTRFSQSLLATPRYEGGSLRLPPMTALMCQIVRFAILALLAWRTYVEINFAAHPTWVENNIRDWIGVDVFGLSTLQLFGLALINILLLVGIQAGSYIALFMLFTDFLKGEIFTRKAGVWLRLAGIFSLSFVVITPIRSSLTVALLTLHLNQGPYWQIYWPNAWMLYDFVIGIVGFVLGQVFIAAAEMAEDHAQIV